MAVRLGDRQALILNSDYREWKALLQAAGARWPIARCAAHGGDSAACPGRARADGDERYGVVEHGVAARYQRVMDAIRRDVADRIGVLLWAERKGVHDAI